MPIELIRLCGKLPSTRNLIFIEQVTLAVLCVCSSSQVSVYPRIEQPENPNSRKVRMRELFRVQRERKKLRKEQGFVPSPQLVVASSGEFSGDGSSNNSSVLC